MTASAVLYTNTMTEKALQEAIRQTCQAYKKLYYHTHRSEHSPAGFPDTVICDPLTGRLLFAELKRAGKRPTAAQQEWLEGLGQVKTVDTYLWRPCDLDRAIAIIQGTGV